MRGTSPDIEALLALHQEIAALVRAGIPLETGLRQAAAAWPTRFSALAGRLSQRLAQGSSLVEALRQEGPAVSPVYLALVEAGLSAGRLPEVLEGLADVGLRTQELRRSVWLAVIYPCLVISLAYVLMLGFVWKIVPIWIETRAAISLPPRMLFTLLERMHQTVDRWGPVLPVCVAVWLFWRVLVREDHGMRWLVSGSWLPGISILRWNLSLARFARLLALLIEQRLPAARAVELAARTVDDARLQATARSLCLGLEQGDSWQTAISGAQRLPPFLQWMMIAGEQQGNLPDVLRQAAETYQRQADRWLVWFRSTLPVVLVGGCCGLVALIYCLGLFLPLQQLWFDLSLEP